MGTLPRIERRSEEVVPFKQDSAKVGQARENGGERGGFPYYNANQGEKGVGRRNIHFPLLPPTKRGNVRCPGKLGSREDEEEEKLLPLSDPALRGTGVSLLGVPEGSEVSLKFW